MRLTRGESRSAFAAALALVLLQGCVRVSMREPIATFQEGVAKAGTSMGAYYAEMNRFERDLYLDERLYDPTLEVNATDAQNLPTPLLGKTFSPESIRARQDAIALLGAYAERLTALAGNESPAQFTEGSKVMGEHLGTLTQRVSVLSQQGDSSAAKYVGPVGQLVGVLGDMFLESRREKALEVAVDKGAPQVRAIVELLEADLTEVIKPQRLTGLKQGLAMRVAYYNDARGRLSLAERREVLEDIKKAVERYEELVVFNPTQLTGALRDAHEGLVTFAKSERTPKNFEEFVGVMKSFQGRIDAASEGVKRIQNPNPEG
jgi:tetratricopeptide (TPR) repeat protein